MITPTLNGLQSPALYIFNFLIAIGGRMLDMASTRYVTRDLKLETNALARKLGFKGMILLQLPAAILGGLDTSFAFFIFIWSLLTTAANLEGSWFIRREGEDEYRRRLIEAAKRTPWRRIIIGEINLLVSLVVAGILIIVFIFLNQDYLAIFAALALVCHGAVTTGRSILFIKHLRELPDENDVSPPEEVKENTGEPSSSGLNQSIEP